MSVTTMLPRILEEFPADLRTPMWHFAEMLEERYIIPHQDFTEMKHTVERSDQRLDRISEAVERLAEAQQRTEQKVEQLAEAQQRTEQRVEQLAEAQQRTEQKVEQLAEAQQHTEQRLNRLTETVDRLAEAQQRTEQAIQALTTTVQDLKQSMNERFAELGSRWGLHTESAFRNTIRRIVRDMDGVTVTSGTYGGRQVDVVIRNGEHILLEITARMHRNDIRKLYQSADEYAVKEGVEPTLMIATAYVSPRLMEEVVNLERPIEIFSYDDEDEDPAEIE